MKNLYITCIVSVILSGGFSASADAYEDVMRQVEANNASLHALRQENMAEQSSMKIDGNLSATEVEFEHVWARDGGERKWSIGVSQEFDFPGVYVARRKEMQARREALELKYRAELTDVVVRAWDLLIEIAYCNKAIELEQAIVNDMNGISELLSRAYDNGESTILEVNRSKIELANNMVRLREVKERKNACVIELRSLGCIISDDKLVTYPLATLRTLQEYQSLLENDPLVAYYQQLKRAELLGGKTRKMEMFPGIKVGYIHEYEDGMSFNGFSVGISLPFFSNRGKRALSKAMQLKSDWSETAARVERESAVDVAYNKAAMSKELIDVLAPVFYKNNHVELLLKAYKGGQMSVIDYLREITFFRESEWNFLQLEMDYHVALNQLNKSLMFK